MSAALRSGIIGTGFIGGVHARAVRGAGGMLTVVADSSPESAEQGRERLAAGRAAASAQELIDSEDVDVVHVCTPNHLHAPLAEQALAAGKHVVCEKPLATTLDAAQRLADLADKAGVVTAVPFVYRYYPTVREVRSRVRAGEAGPLWLLHGSYLQDWLAGESENNWRVDPALGGASRAFADIGVHWCDLMEFSTGHRITSLTAVFASAYERRGPDGAAPVSTEDGAVLLFRTDRGATGSLVTSQVSPGRKNRLWFSFDGTSASYSFDQELPDSLWVGGKHGNTTVHRSPDLLSPEAGAYVTLPAGHPQGYQDSFNAFIADTYAAITGPAPEGSPTFADGLRAAQITAAVLDSAQSHSWVEVPT